MRQLFLPMLSIQEHFNSIHGKHKEDVAVCSSFSSENKDWQENVYAHNSALFAEMSLVVNSDTNVYQSQNGFDKDATYKHRTIQNIAALTSFFVDLDVYNIPRLVNISLDGLLDKVMAEFPWLPVPTLTVSSGRGYYFQWVFHKTISRSKISQWQVTEDMLVELLRPFGGDIYAKDASRVLRVVGSTNTKNGELVAGYRQTGGEVKFKTFSDLIHREGAKVIDNRFDKEVIPGQPKRQATAKQKEQYLRALNLMPARIDDCHTLARLRQSPAMSDYRHRLAYVHAISCTAFCSDIGQAKHDIDAFSLQHFREPDNYTHKRFKTALDRMYEKQRNVTRIYEGRIVDSIYRLWTKTIIDILDITAGEQVLLKTFICKQEKDRRRELKRRAEGMIPREQYLAISEDRRQQALALMGCYHSQADIARELGITQQDVSYLLKKPACG